MRPDLLARLACPDCRGALSHVSAARPGEGPGDDRLLCSGCGRSAPIRIGIPRLLPSRDLGAAQRSTAEHFTAEFSANTTRDEDLGDADLNAWIFYTRTGLDPTVLTWQPPDWYPTALPPQAPSPDPGALAGCWVLDAGCGPGRLARAAAQTSSHLVGLDLGDHIDRAAQVLSGQDNVDLVQGSVLDPPFADASFDVVYSVGVLHHSPAPEAAVRALARLVRPGGRLSVWVYPPEYWGGAIRGPVNRLLHRWLSAQSPEAALRFVRRYLYPLGRAQGAVARHRPLRVLLAPIFLVSVPRLPNRAAMIATILDYFGPKIISTHTPAEVVAWLERAGLVDVEALPVRSSAIGRQPVEAR